MTKKKSRYEDVDEQVFDDERPPDAWPDPEDDLKDEPEPEPKPEGEAESVRQPKPGEVLPTAPYSPHGRHVLDFHMRRVAHCVDLPGQTAPETAAMIAKALNQ